MKLIICGSRTIVPTGDYETKTVDLGFSGSGKQITYINTALMFQWIDLIAESVLEPVTEVVSGAAKGGDQFGELWAQARGIPVKSFPVRPEEWRLLGKSAGMVRNRKMGDYVAKDGAENSGVLAIWDGQSKGTAGMLEYAGKLGIKRVVLKSDGKWYTLGG